MVISISGLELEARLKDAGGYSLVNFTALWCSPCLRIEPNVEKIASEKEKLNVFKIDVDEDPILASRFGVRSVPNLLLIKDGKPVSHHAGFVSLAELKTWLEVYGV